MQGEGKGSGEALNLSRDDTARGDRLFSNTERSTGGKTKENAPFEEGKGECSGSLNGQKKDSEIIRTSKWGEIMVLKE